MFRGSSVAGGDRVNEVGLEVLERRVQTLLPDLYQSSGETVQPVSMGSAGLTFRLDGTVAWDEIWTSFCHLAMAGGPPHKGSLLEPGKPSEIRKNAGRYKQVVDEIGRGISMVTGLEVERSSMAGWVRVDCPGEGMAGWMTRAIAMENVSVRCVGAAMYLPAGPGYRLEKEIKNVITVMAKTHHYWRDHTGRARQQAIADLLAEINLESPLQQTAVLRDEALAGRMMVAIERNTGLSARVHPSAGWLGVDCGSVSAAIWMMRMVVASNVLSRREETTVFLPVNAETDPDGDVVTRVLGRMYAFAVAKGIAQAGSTLETISTRIEAPMRN